MQVFDECHHTQNNHPFNKVALKYRQLTDQQQSYLQVLLGTNRCAPCDNQPWPAAKHTVSNASCIMCLVSFLLILLCTT